MGEYLASGYSGWPTGQATPDPVQQVQAENPAAKPSLLLAIKPVTPGGRFSIPVAISGGTLSPATLSGAPLAMQANPTADGGQLASPFDARDAVVPGTPQGADSQDNSGQNALAFNEKLWGADGRGCNSRQHYLREFAVLRNRRHLAIGLSHQAVRQAGPRGALAQAFDPCRLARLVKQCGC